MSGDACPTCGRAKVNWQDRHSAALSGKVKVEFSGSNEDRLASYRQWHRTLSPDLICADIDQIEWRLRDGAFVPVATLEMSRVDGDPGLPRSYCEAVLARMMTRDAQGNLARLAAARLGVPVYVVLFHVSLTEFYVHNLTTPNGWRKMKRTGYQRWLEAL